MTKIASFVSLALVAAGVSAGCAVDSQDVGMEDVGTGEQAVCQTNQDHAIDAMFATIATAMAAELGRWDIVKDFEVAPGYSVSGPPYYVPEQVRLKAGGTQSDGKTKFGAARCTNGCPATKALLSFQNDSLSNKYVFAGPNGSQVTFAADVFRNRLVSGYRAQQTCDARPLSDTNSCSKVEAHQMSIVGSRPGTCDGRLDITKAKVVKWDANNPTSELPLQMLGYLAYKLVWANEGDLPVANYTTWNYDTLRNPYLQFRVLTPDVLPPAGSAPVYPDNYPKYIEWDPSVGGSGLSSSGSCGTSLLMFSTTDITGACCVISGVQKSYQPYTVTNYYICK